MKKIFYTLISLGLMLSFPTVSFARDVDPDQELTAEQKVKLTQFSNNYANLMNAIEARMSNAVDLRSPEAKAIFDNLKDCVMLERADGELVELAGDKCGLSYEMNTVTRDLGLNESGDPITEIEKDGYFTSKTDAMTALTGFVSLRTSSLDHMETLISTPSYVKLSTQHVHFVAVDGKAVELTSRARLYTNMENEDQTLFRMMTVEFEKFAARFEIKVFMDYEGKIKSKSGILNKHDVQLEEISDYFTSYLLGLDI